MDFFELAKEYLPPTTIVKNAAKMEQNPDARAKFLNWFNQSNVIAAMQIVRQIEALDEHIKKLTEPAKEDETGIEWTKIKKHMLGYEGQKIASEFIDINNKFKIFSEVISSLSKNPETLGAAISLTQRFMSAAGSAAAQRTILAALSGATGGVAAAAYVAYRLVSEARSLYERTKKPLEEKFEASTQKTLSA